MKNIAIIKNMKGEIVERKNFRSYPEVERYIAKKYANAIFDWMIDQELVEGKPDAIDLALGLDKGRQWAKVHSIVIRGI